MEPASLEAGFAGAVAAMGRIDVLASNGHEALPKDWTDVTHEAFSRQWVNASGYFILARLLRGRAVERSAPASIIMLGSMYGQVTSCPGAYERGSPTLAPIACTG